MTIPRWKMALAWASVAVALVSLFALPPLIGGDLVMHLALGRWIWQSGAIPHTDLFTFTTPGRPFIAHSWLAELIFYGVEGRAGTLGFVLLRFTLVTTALLFALRTARLLGASWLALMLLAPVVLTLMWARLDFRPLLFSSLWLSVELWLLVSIHTGPRSSRWLWVLPPVYALWINLHGGWPLGLLTLVAAMGAALVMQVRGGPPSHLALRHLALVFVACVAALFLNPYGSALVTFPLTMQQPWIRAMGPEWQSPWYGEGWRLVGGGVFVDLRPVYFGYAALLVGILLTALRRWRTADLVPAAVMTCWLGLSLWHLRTVSDMALLTGPLVVAALPAKRASAKFCGSIGIGLLLGLASYALWCGATHKHREALWRWNHAEPACAMAALARLNLSGPVHSSHLNHWLIWRLGERFQVNFVWEFAAGERHT